jgi:hypothetical protein
VVLVVGLVLGLVRGSRLRWDQLALSAVTTKTIEGVTARRRHQTSIPLTQSVGAGDHEVSTIN